MFRALRFNGVPCRGFRRYGLQRLGVGATVFVYSPFLAGGRGGELRKKNRLNRPNRLNPKHQTPNPESLLPEVLDELLCRLVEELTVGSLAVEASLILCGNRRCAGLGLIRVSGLGFVLRRAVWRNSAGTSLPAGIRISRTTSY